MFTEVLKIRYHLLFGKYNYATANYESLAQPVAPTLSAEPFGGAASASTN
jgi:hypothetical protein